MTEQSNLNSSPPLVMHPALTNLEVIYTICSFTQHGSLPALASTYRAFEHPALNSLWRDLQSVEPLVKCLPNNLFGVDQGGVVLRKPPDDGMWHTLFKYTSRVHSIIVPRSNCDRAVIEPLCLLMLSCSSPPGSLFLNLCKLKWGANGTHCAADFLRMMFVPSLVEFKLDMHLYSASSAFLSVLSSLGTLCPHLQNMTLSFAPPPTHALSVKLSPFIIRPISQFHHLHTLSIWDIGIQGMERFVELQALESLRLDLTVSSTWHTKSDLSFPGFHDLTLLDLATRKIEHASNFWSSLQFVRTRGINVDFTCPGASTTIPQFFDIVQERCDNHKLKSISVNGAYRSGQVHKGQSFFAPLRTCCNLTQLFIGSICDISMSDEELCQLVKAWPKLQMLQIKCYTASKMPTFHGLIDLLWRCPALTSLALAIDVTKLIGIDLKSPGGGRCNKRLKFLALGNSPTEVPVNVALIINGLFPNLKKVNLDCWNAYPATASRSTSVKQQWELVNSIIGGFNVVRERDIEPWSDC
ncbi:hypothetical protein BDR03DRAFT_1087596 [Suillus americanus]|nr:hypothetical protein BDR03DRAFT_1087596 [Suillus americanus]